LCLTERPKIMEWYYSQNSEQRGPVSDAELAGLNQAGTITTETLIWREGWSNWRKFSDANRPSEVAAPGTAACAECGKAFPTSEMIQYESSWVCANCKPIFFQKIKEGVPLAGDLHYAGFWIRLVAVFIDAIILNILNIPLRLMIGFGSADPNVQLRIVLLSAGISMIIGAAYDIFFVGKFGATPGKMALRLRIIRTNGDKVSYGRACGRYFGKVLSSFTLCIGYLMAAFDEQKRSLHDRICDTRVIRLNA
jgi:uncharacterized RDD family membrane protein YckC